MIQVCFVGAGPRDRLFIVSFLLVIS
ncbi:hypothetical protein AERO9A_340222 [Aeromonas salmonicida]|nr:hypothetical protein AERO9A_340222 [Aeromonas salmonicida]